MPENFTDAQRIKNKRGNSFGGTAREIKEILSPPPAPKAPPKQVVASKPAPQPVQAPVTKPMAITETVVDNSQDKLTIQKGFVVGKTEDGKILFKPFGQPDKLELIGFVEYAKAVSTDLLNELANTSTAETRAIKTGMAAALQGITALLNGQSQAGHVDAKVAR